ncbi:hypothetical protein ACHQM5_019872 [Ranunculus cassubicifolius]
MAPKEDANRLNLIEKTLSIHEEGFERLHQQYSDLKEQQSRDMSTMTAAITRLTESIANMTVGNEPSHLKTAAPPDPSASTQPAKLNPGATSLLGTSPTPASTTDPPATQILQQASTLIPKLPRIEFPKFNGTQVRSWLQKTQRFFLLQPMDDNQKILFASLNFSDAADAWFQTDSLRFAALSWKEFALLVQQRFSEELSENVIGEFKLLSLKSSVLEYHT